MNFLKNGRGDCRICGCADAEIHHHGFRFDFDFLRKKLTGISGHLKHRRLFRRRLSPFSVRELFKVHQNAGTLRPPAAERETAAALLEPGKPVHFQNPRPRQNGFSFCEIGFGAGIEIPSVRNAVLLRVEKAVLRSIFSKRRGRRCRMNDKIQVLERAFHVLELVAQDTERPHTVGELAELSGLKVQTLSKIVRTMTQLGYLENTGRKKGYVIGEKLLRLSETYRDLDALRRLVRPHLRIYAEQIGEYICFSVLRGYYKRIVCKIRAKEANPRFQYTFPAEENAITGFFPLSTKKRFSNRILIKRCKVQKKFWEKRKEISKTEEF